MTPLFRLALMILLMISAAIASARDIAGVNVPERITVEGVPLVLNGAGIRTKFFIKVYVGALYLPAPQRDAASVLGHAGASAVHMHFAHDVSQEKIVSAWNDGFAANTTEAERPVLGARLARFNQIFRDMRAGDVVRIEYAPGKGTRVSINGEPAGLIEGADFNRALLGVWLGASPVDADLKRAMLGSG